MDGFSKQSKYLEGYPAHEAKHFLPTREMALGEPFCNQEVLKKNL
jgi:hypothetical protein